MKHDLSDVTFIIPAKIAHGDRFQNASITLNFLNTNFNTNIIVYELGHPSHTTEEGYTEEPIVSDLTEKFENFKLMFEPGRHEDGAFKTFYRTRFLNRMLAQVETPIVVNYDLDVIPQKEALCQAVELIRESSAELVYPFGFGRYQHCIPQVYRDNVIIPYLAEHGFEATDNFYRELDLHSNRTSLPVSNLRTMKKMVEKHLDTDTIKEFHYTLENLTIERRGAAYGHCQVIKTEAYREAGGENENFFPGYPEDKERYYRFRKLGYKIQHIPEAIIYHFEHHVDKDSAGKASFWDHSLKEHLKVMSLSPEEMKNYITTLKYENETELPWR
jgi:hypothetical protein